MSSQTSAMAVSMTTPHAAVTPARRMVSGRDSRARLPSLACGRPRAGASATRHPRGTGGGERVDGVREQRREWRKKVGENAGSGNRALSFADVSQHMSNC